MKRIGRTLGVGGLLLAGAVLGRIAGGTPSVADAVRTAAPAPAPSIMQPTVAAQPSAAVPAPAAAPTLLAQVTPAAAAPAAPPAPVAAPPPVTVAVPVVAAPPPPSVYTEDPQAVARINQQIDALLSPPSGGFAVQYYSKPAPPPAPYPPPGTPAAAPPQIGERLQPREEKKYVIARAGDSVYATLDRGFNSDDPQAPIFATIHDVDQAGIQGPLDNVRMIGNIIYSSSQGTIQFQTGYLPDGRPIQVKAIAISEDTTRTGIAKDVDTHDLERYGGLLFGALVQGAGTVGQTLLQNNQRVSVNPNTGLVSETQQVSPYQAGLTAALPVGQALTAVAAQGFNRPATMTGPAGMGIQLVFLDQVAVPADVLYARAR